MRGRLLPAGRTDPPEAPAGPTTPRSPPGGATAFRPSRREPPRRRTRTPSRRRHRRSRCRRRSAAVPQPGSGRVTCPWRSLSNLLADRLGDREPGLSGAEEGHPVEDPLLETLDVQVEDRRDVKGDELGHDKTADDDETDRPAGGPVCAVA